MASPRLPAPPDGVDPQRWISAQRARATFDFQRSEVGRPETERLTYRLRRPLAAVAKAAARQWGTITSGRRALPHFLVIGAKRAGSTTLFRGLVDGGGVAPMFPARENRKGVYYFDVHHHRGARWYRGHMPRTACLDGQVVGEASPYYLSHPHAADRAAALVPSARIVAVLRDPVARAHSHYNERCRQGVEYLPTFETAIDAEEQRLDGETDRMLADPSYVSWEHLNFGYLDQSRYAANLARWYAAFPAEQILVVQAESLYADPSAVLAEVRHFIGLEPVDLQRVAHHNKLATEELDEAVHARVAAALASDTEQLDALIGRRFCWSDR